MKKFLHKIVLVGLVVVGNVLNAQTIYDITNNTTVTEAGIPAQCGNCIINISSGITLTIDKNIYLTNTVFNGGKVLANQSITFWVMVDLMVLQLRLMVKRN